MKKLAVICLVTIGIVFSGVLLYAYNNDNKYDPSGSLADIQINQVVFDDDKINDFSNNKDNNNSDLWEKDNSSLNKDRPNQSNDSNYLYNNKTANNNLNINDNHNSQNNNSNIQGEKDTIYDVVDDKNKADKVIDVDKPSDDDNKKDDDKPIIKDPEKQKSNSVDPYIPNNKNYSEDEVSDRHEKRTVVICKSYDSGSDELYYGQIITPRMIFNYLDTYVDVGNIFTDNITRYFWNDDAYDKYVRIDAVSFDGGETFIYDFPVTIPQGVDLVIKAAYRYSTNDEWTSQLVNYEVSENRTIVLKNKLTGDSIKNEDIANRYEQYYASGKKVNLLKFVNEMYGLSYVGSIDKLFPGWMEDGKEVGWFYTTGYSRHILEPMDFIDVDDKFSLTLTIKWIDQNLHEDLSNGEFSYLQTLTNYQSDEYDDYYFPFVDTLEVPRYVQAIEFGDDAFLRMNYVSVPDTVLTIDNSNAYFEVVDGWNVNEDNPNYCSDNGLLFNKQKNQILDIPSSMETLKVDESIEYVAINRGNNLQKLIFDTKDSDKIPDVILDYLFDCKILVNDEILDTFVENKYSYIQDLYGVSIAAIDNEDVSYILKNNAIISDQGLLRKALDYSSMFKIDSSVNKIKANAFDDTININNIIILKDVDDLTIEKDAFINSSVKTISCSTVEQYNSLMAQKDNFGKKDIEIKMLSVSADGYSYIVEDGEVTVLNAPSDVKTFDGTLTLENGSILNVNTIADNAFVGCNELEIVSLAESVKTIGYRAFANCEKLNGVLIKSKDYVEIGDLAFDNCTLRFFASNAMYAYFDNNYFPYNFGNYYVFENAIGYNGYPSYFVNADIVAYDIYKTGERGAVLYGVGEVGDYWLAIESANTLDKNVKLPSETVEIFSSSFAFSVSEDGQSYSINWDELVNLEFIDEAAFAYSALGEDIVIDKTVMLDTGSTFMGCSYLKTFKMNNSEAISISDNFQYCYNLVSVEFNDVSDIKAASFEGCDSLETIKLNSSIVPVLTIFSTNGTMYYFNDNFGNEESKKISFILPQAIQEEFIKERIYLFAGYADAKGMWNGIKTKLTDSNNLIFPSDEEVWDAFYNRLLLTENTMREFMNLDLVTSPTYLPDKATFFTGEDARQVNVDGVTNENNTEEETNDIEKINVEDKTNALEEAVVEDKTSVSEEVVDIEDTTNEEEKINEETNIDKEKEMVDTYDN